MVLITFILINMIQAIWHWYLIERRNILVKSPQKILEYAALSLIAGIAFINRYEWYDIVAFCFLSRVAIYDIVLNIMRGKNWLYEGEIKKAKSWSDWIENKIGLPVWAYRIVYLSALLIYSLIYLI